MIRVSHLLTLLLAVLGAPAAFPADGPPRVYRDRIVPHWLDGGTSFWYRVETGRDQSEFVYVDAETGLRRPAFDHNRLAGALAAAVGRTNISPANLPLSQLEFVSSRNEVAFRFSGKRWSLSLSDYSLRHVTNAPGSALSSLREGVIPRASSRTGAETTIQFANLSATEVQLFWLDADGKRRGYGRLEPGEARDQHTFAGHVWLVADSDGNELQLFQAADDFVRAEITGDKAPAAVKREPAPKRRRGMQSPDGKFEARFHNHNLMVVRVADEGVVVRTEDGTTNNAYAGTAWWSPDSLKLVVLKTTKADDTRVYLVESSPEDGTRPKLHTHDYLKPGDRIAQSQPHLFDLEGGREIPVDDSLFSNPWSISDFRWEPDSSRFTFLYNQRGHQVLRLVAIEALTGETSSLIEERSRTFINYSGKQFLQQFTSDEHGSEAIWMSERDGWNHLYLYDTRTGRVKSQITSGEWPVQEVDHVDLKTRQVWFRAGGMQPGEDPYHVHYCRVNFDGSGLTVLTAGDGTHQAQFSPDQSFFVDTWSRVNHPPVIELRRASDGSLLCPLEKADVAELDAAEIRYPERFVAKGRDNETDIYGIIHWPKSYDPSRKYPIIESIYAGPQGAFVPKSFHATYGTRALTDCGFIVVQIDGMGTSLRSKKFHDVCWRNLGDSGFPDRILWIKAAAAKFPAMDLSRVGIYGTSAGGQSALRALLAHGDFYRAAVADCGCHDNRVDKIWWNEQWMGWPLGPHYAEQSNVTQAHKLTGKLLLMVGELDTNVDPASTMQVVNALIKADKDFELLVVPGAGHGVLGQPYAQRRMIGFFEKSL